MVDELRIIIGKQGEKVEGGKRFAILDDKLNCGVAYDTPEEVLGSLRRYFLDEVPLG